MKPSSILALVPKEQNAEMFLALAKQALLNKENKQLIKENKQKEKANKKINNYLKHILSKIKKAALNGDTYIKYTGKWYSYFDIYLALRLSEKLVKNNFRCHLNGTKGMIGISLLIYWS